MICESCHRQVTYIITVFKQVYADDGQTEAGVSKHHFCPSCIQTLDADSYADDSDQFIGTPKTR